MMNQRRVFENKQKDFRFFFSNVKKNKYIFQIKIFQPRATGCRSGITRARRGWRPCCPRRRGPTPRWWWRAAPTGWTPAPTRTPTPAPLADTRSRPSSRSTTLPAPTAHTSSDTTTRTSPRWTRSSDRWDIYNIYNIYHIYNV